MMTTESRNDGRLVRRLMNVIVQDPSAVVEFTPRELDLLLRLARRVRLLGRLGERLYSADLLNSLPASAADQLKSAMAMSDARARLALWELNRIARAMGNDADVPLIVMKGCAYLLLDLPNAAGRVFADVDLMTSEQYLEIAESTLNDNGWVSSDLTPYDQNYYRKWTHELPPLTHEDREVEIDLHHNIVPRTARLKPSSEKLLERSKPLPNSRYRVLADEDIVLHTMTHLMFDSDFSNKLRDLVDIHDLLLHFSNVDRLFWQKLLARADELDLARPAYYSIHYSHELLGLSVPTAVMESARKWAPPRIVGALMDSLIPRALYPQHPDRPSKLTEFCRLLLYVRSHWIRMPPWLLVYHLSYKFVKTRLRRD